MNYKQNKTIYLVEDEIYLVNLVALVFIDDLIICK
jgi:hypothetical protein